MIRNLRGISLLLTISLILSLFVPYGAVSAEEGTTKTITILGTSDIHSYIYPWDYKLATGDDDAGLAKLYSVVKEVRAENPNTLLVDNGDTIQGTELSDVYKKDDTVTHPMMAVMNYMGYDAWTLGNHEFNYGLEVLNRLIKDAEFPVLGANIYNADGTNFVKPYIVKEVDGVKIGILGMVSPNIQRWDKDNVVGMEFNSLITEGKKWVKVLKEEEKVDLVFASIHAGLEGEYWTDGGDSIKAVAEQVDGIDAILAGHAHSDIEGELINGVLIAEPKAYGNRIAKFDFTFEMEDGKLVLADKKVENINTKSYDASSEVLELAKSYHEKTLEYVNTPIGEATADFVPAGQVPGIPVAQIQDTALVDLINEVQLETTGADVSLAALFISESNLKKGPLTIKDAAYIYKYDNTLFMTKVSGKELKGLMEWSASYFNTFKPGDVTISFNEKIRGYNYDMFAGVNYEIDITEEPGNRIKNLTFKGQPVTDDMELTLALNNYRYNGMSSEGLITGEKLFDSYEKYGDQGQIRNLIAKYIKEKGTISPEVDNNWKIVGANLEHWAKEDAYTLLEKEIIDIPVSEDGRTPNVKAINLDEKVTRGEFITALVKAMGLEVAEVKETKFNDVSEKLAPFVQAGLDAKITSGISENQFGTDKVITREEAVTLLLRALNLPFDQDLGEYAEFTDRDKVSTWAKNSLAKALQIELLKGTSNTTLTPKMELTRGQLVSFINRILAFKGLKQIDIYATNDFHGNLEAGYEGGIAKLAAVFNYYKQQNPEGTILLDAGDRYQGTPLSNLFFGEPVAEAFEKIGYDAVTVGNHEFDWGIEQLLNTRKEANVTFPLLAANIYDKATNKPVTWADPYTIIELDGVKVGIIGLATPETLESVKLDYIKDYDVKDPIEVANLLVPEVKKAGADVVVLLTHEPGYVKDGQITGALADLANEVEGIAGIIGGHSHKNAYGYVNGIPVAEAYYNGRMLSHITLFYNPQADKVVKSAVGTIEVRNTTLDVEPVKEVQDIVDLYNEEVAPIFSEIVGTTTVELVRDYNNESNMGNWMADVMKEKAGTQIAFQNAGGIRADMDAGDITLKEIFTVMPFDNTIVTAEMTGAQIKAVLEQSVTLYKGMMQISGLKVKYDSTLPEKERIIEIALEDGTVVEMDKTYTVATNDFLSGGQDGYTTLGEVEWTNTYDLVRDALIENVKALKEISPKVEDRMFDVSKAVQVYRWLKAA